MLLSKQGISLIYKGKASLLPNNFDVNVQSWTPIERSDNEVFQGSLFIFLFEFQLSRINIIIIIFKLIIIKMPCINLKIFENILPYRWSRFLFEESISFHNITKRGLLFAELGFKGIPVNWRKHIIHQVSSKELIVNFIDVLVKDNPIFSQLLV